MTKVQSESQRAVAILQQQKQLGRRQLVEAPAKAGHHGNCKGGKGLCESFTLLVVTTKPLLSAAALTPFLENEAGFVPDDPPCNLT